MCYYYGMCGEMYTPKGKLQIGLIHMYHVVTYDLFGLR